MRLWSPQDHELKPPKTRNNYLNDPEEFRKGKKCLELEKATLNVGRRARQLSVSSVSITVKDSICRTSLSGRYYNRAVNTSTTITYVGNRCKNSSKPTVNHRGIETNQQRLQIHKLHRLPLQHSCSSTASSSSCSSSSEERAKRTRKSSRKMADWETEYVEYDWCVIWRRKSLRNRGRLMAHSKLLSLTGTSSALTDKQCRRISGDKLIIIPFALR